MISSILAAALALASLDVTTARLDNGMTIVVSRDPHVSDAAVELWFRAGSSDEAAGQHGIAHLFEHNLPGAQHVLGDAANLAAYRRDLLDGNGSTGTDYSNFFMRVPATSIELPIAILADRMSVSADAITDATLARNRDIVIAEFRNAAGRRWDPTLTNPVRAALFGSHPYGHAVLGTVTDVDAVTTEEIRRWFRAHYGAANAMLVVAGNVDPAQVIALARKHFGSIPPGDAHPLALPAVTPSTERKTVAIAVPQAIPSTILAWRTPPWSDAQRQDLMIAIELLRARLQSTLHCDVPDGDGFSGSAGGEASLDVRYGDPAAIAGVLDGCLGSTPDIAPARAARLANVLESLDALGWRSSRTEWLGQGMWFANDVHAYAAQLAAIERATPESVMRAANVWLRNPLVVRVAPATSSAPPDRTATLPIVRPPAPDVPNVVESQGLLTVSRAVPVVIGRIDDRTSVTSFSTVPSRALPELQLLLQGHRPAAVILVGDVDRDRVERLLRNLPPAEPAQVAPARANVGVIASFPGADPARISVAADLLRSRLNARSRETERWSYNVDVHTEKGDTIVVETLVNDDIVGKATAVIHDALAALPHESLSAADAARAAGSELHRLERLASTASDLADELVVVARSGQSYLEYVRSHRELYESLKEGASIGLPEPTFRTPRPLS